MVFEDSISETKSAFDAGAKVVAITTTLPAGKHNYAHKIIPYFEGLSVEFVRHLL